MSVQSEVSAQEQKKQNTDASIKASVQTALNHRARKGPVGKAARRRESRRCLVQALYQSQLAQLPVSQLIDQFQFGLFEESDKKPKVDWPYFSESLEGILGSESALDAIYQPFIDRELQRLDPTEKAILRLGVYELVHRLDIPYRVVINEALELSKVFAGSDSHRYINSILDKVSDQVRAVEKRPKSES